MTSRADGLDHHLHLARLQVAAVILHGQLHAGVDDARAEAAYGLDHVVDVHLDLRPFGIAAEDAAHALRAEDLRDLERTCHLRFERAQSRVERSRARTHRAVCELQLDPQPIGVLPDLSNRRLVIQHRGGDREHRPGQLDRREVVEELDRRELIPADAAVDRADLDIRGPARQTDVKHGARRPRCPEQKCVDPFRRSSQSE